MATIEEPSKQSHRKRGQKNKCSYLNLKNAVTIEDAIRHTFRHLNRHGGRLAPQHLCVFWTKLCQLLFVPPNWKCDERSRPRYKQQMKTLSTHTIDTLTKPETYLYADAKDITGILFGIGKVVKHVPTLGNEWRCELFNNLILGFKDVLSQSDTLMKQSNFFRKFNERCLANFARACSLSNYLPVYDDGLQLFDHIAIDAIHRLGKLNAQETSGLVCSYANLGIVHDALLGNVADAFLRMDLHSVESKYLSNTVWAYAKVGARYACLFNAVGAAVITRDLNNFEQQELTNIVWAYATAGEYQHVLFERIADHIVLLDELPSFKPQHLSNIAWSYATAGKKMSQLFGRISDSIVTDRDNLEDFKQQELANLVWAYAKSGVPSSDLFAKVAGAVTSIDLKEFEDQNLSVLVWSFAKMEESNPVLFQKVAEVIIDRDMLLFHPRSLANIAWAYTTSKEDNSRLFDEIANAAIATHPNFDAQSAANILWAFASRGHLNDRLFTSFVPTLYGLIEYCTNQEVANIAWSYAVSDIVAPELFDDWFVNFLLCKDAEMEFDVSELCQIHQWQTWQVELGSNLTLPSDFKKRCFNAFVSQGVTISEFQLDVVRELGNIGFSLQQEYITPSGYSIDALVELNDQIIGIEVDGPSHFIGQVAMGRSILKWRQVYLVDGIRIVSVPYYEWPSYLETASKQEYLCSKLGLQEGHHTLLTCQLN